MAVGIKDIIAVDGFETRCGSALPPELFDWPQASCVTRLLAAGGVILGKTVTTEFAYYEPGPTRNPRKLTHTPGGSSSGSAAAVAAGLCPLAIGSQTQGSVIRPAAFCGIVGFKPTFGRIPIDGVLPFSPSIDTLGTFTADVATAALAASVLVDDWSHGDAPEPTFAVPRGPLFDHVEPDALAAFERTMATLRRSGLPVIDIDAMDDFEQLAERHRDLIAAEVAEVHRDWFARYGDRYRPKSRAIIEHGRSITAARLAACRDSRSQLRIHLGDMMTRHSITALLTPAAPGPAPATLDSTGDPVMNLPFTHAGMPAVTLPAGSIDGLPLGLQVVGHAHDDERLLAAAATLEAAI